MDQPDLRRSSSHGTETVRIRQKIKGLESVGSDTGSPSMLVGLFATILEKPNAVKDFRPISDF